MFLFESGDASGVDRVLEAVEDDVAVDDMDFLALGIDRAVRDCVDKSGCNGFWTAEDGFLVVGTASMSPQGSSSPNAGLASEQGPINNTSLPFASVASRSSKPSPEADPEGALSNAAGRQR